MLCCAALCTRLACLARRMAYLPVAYRTLHFCGQQLGCSLLLRLICCPVSLSTAVAARCAIARCLARQWFGVLLRAATPLDEWLVEGKGQRLCLTLSQGFRSQWSTCESM